jgi:hypothetical protein
LTHALKLSILTCERKLSFLPSCLVAQAEREDVVKWLVWSRADPAKRSGEV